MTSANKEQLKDKLKQKILREALAYQSPLGLAVIDDDAYEAPRHIKLLNKKLLEVSEGDIERLMVYMPPRHGKSELCSKYFPAWYLGTHPEDRVILTSYEADFAATWGQKVRDVLKEYNDTFGVKVNDRSAARNRWDIAGHRGGMGTAGVGGPITGKGAEVLIIDDPIKDAMQANSPTFRERAKDWYRSTAYTRLTPTGKVVLIQTRWHEDDLGGWLVSEDKQDEWEIIEFPAIAVDDNDALGRSVGDPLWPELWTLEKLMGRKEVLGSYWFSAMYQQSPQPPEGGMLKRNWIQYYDHRIRKRDYQIYTGWDLAISQKDTADYTTSCTVAVENGTNDIYIIDWTRDHITFNEQIQMVNRQYDKHVPALIGIETVAYQAALPQAILVNRLLPIKNMVPNKDKVTKITSTFTAFEQGKVYLPNDHPLLREFEHEYIHFPTGKHDDLLDATEMAISLAKMGNNPYTENDNAYDFSKYNNKRRRR